MVKLPQGCFKRVETLRLEFRRNVLQPVGMRIASCQSSPAKVFAESLLLDLAVLDSGGVSPHFIPLRVGTSFDLGDAVTNIGFPLVGVLAESPMSPAVMKVPSDKA